MADIITDPLPFDRLERLETAVARLRYVAIAVVVVMVASFAFLGVQFWRLNGRIDQLAAKVDGLDVAVGVKFDVTNANIDAVSQRLAVEFKTMGAEIASQTSALGKSIPAASGGAPAPPSPAPAQPAPTPIPKPAPVNPPRSRP
jgi:hypothetical protein